MRTPVYALLHYEAARHRSRAGDCAVRGERPRRQDRGGEQTRRWHNVSPRLSASRALSRRWTPRQSHYGGAPGEVRGDARDNPLEEEGPLGGERALRRVTKPTD